MDVASAVAKSRMTFRQYLVIFGALLCNLADGYDLSVVGFALPHLPEGFASPAVKGWLISTGLFGMAVGAIFVAPYADRFGRRIMLINGVALNLAAMVATALAPNVQVMFVTRFFTGVAVGILATLSILIAQEYAAADKRNLAAGLVTIGFSIGTIGGGIVGLSLVNAFGGAWQVFFWAGAVLTGIILIYIVVLMPESLSFLVAKGTPEAKEQIATIAARMGLENVDPNAAPPVDPIQKESTTKAALLDRVFRKRSLLLWSAYAILTAGYYFVSSWTPQLIADESGSADVGTTVGTLISVGAMIGAITFGIIGIRVAATKLGWIFLAIAIVSQLVFAMTMSGGVAMVSATVLGFAAFAAMTSYVSVAPQLYPVQLRGRGLGTMYGISRFGSILAPIIAGYAITVVSGRTMYMAASLLFAASCVLTFVLWRVTRLQLETPTRVTPTRVTRLPSPPPPKPDHPTCRFTGVHTMSSAVHPARSTHVDQELDLRIGGIFERGLGGTFQVLNPATEEVIAEVASASHAQIERATALAKVGLDRDEMGDAAERSAALNRLADVLEARTDEILAVSVNEIGTPVSTAKGLHVDAPISVLRWMAQATLTDRTEDLGVYPGPPASASKVIYRPAGVIAGIAAYNYPMLFAAIKVGAAYAAGCPSILLSSPNAPLGILNFGRYVEEAGWPASSVSVLTGGVDTAQHLISRPEVAKISFTGSVPGGKAVMATAAEGLRDVVLELGGKSAAIVLPTADVTSVVAPIHSRYLRNAGQGCASPTRILLYRPQYDAFVDASREYFDSVAVGDPWDPKTLVGPVISERHRTSILGHIQTALDDGGKILAHGHLPERDGWWVAPTLIGGLGNDAQVNQEEIFGPVASVQVYDTVDEAIAIANDSSFGLHATVWGPLAEAMELAPRLDVGQVSLNGGGLKRPDAPNGGWKNSGIGREFGEAGIREFLEPVHIQWPVD